MWVGFKSGDKYLPDLAFLLGDLPQGKARGEKLAELFEKARAEGADLCGVKASFEAEKLLCKGSLAECKAFVVQQETREDEGLLGYLQCVLGEDMWGEDVGSQTHSMFPARDGHKLCLMTVEPPPKLAEASPADQRAYAVALRTRHSDADVIIPKGNKFLVAYMTGGWMGMFEDYILGPGAKGPKRYTSLLKGYQFTAAVSRDQVKVKYIEDLGLENFEECQVDGHIFVDTGFAKEHIFSSKGVELSIERGMKKLIAAYGTRDSVPEKAVELLTEMATRKREDLVRRAMKNTVGSFRALDPDDAMKKGNASLVPDLRSRFGCDIITSRANCKSDIKGKGLPEMKWLFGFDSKPSHFGPSASNTSGQSIGAHQQLFPQEQVKGWISSEVARVTQMLVSGQLERDYIASAENNKRLQDDLGEELHGVLFTFQTAMENLLKAGRGFLDLRFAPYLCLDTFDAMARRMADASRARVSVPVPHSLSCSIMSERLARLAGWQGPEIPEDRITFWKERSMMIFSNTGLKKKLRNLGGADFDDDAHAYLVKDKTSGELHIAVIRYPTDRGEYLLLKPLREKEDVEIFKARKTLSMKFNFTDAVFTFSGEETPIREVDITSFPPQVTTRIESGDLVEVELPKLQGKHQFPDGYTEEAALGLIQKQLVGHQPGRAINLRSGIAGLCGQCPQAAVVLEPKKSYTSMEGIIDLMTQGGSLEAQAEMEKLTEEGTLLLLTQLMNDPSLPRIDRIYAAAKPVFLGDFAPKAIKDFVKAEGHLAPHGQGWISPLFTLHQAATKEAKDNLGRWLLVWQQEAPELVSYLSTETKEEDKGEDDKETAKKKAKRLKKAVDHACAAQDAYTRVVHPLWLALCAEGRKTKGKNKSQQEKRSLEAARARYVEAFSKMVGASHLGAMFIPLRTQRGNEHYPGLYNDRQLWNGVLSDLVVKYYQGVLNAKGKEEKEGSEERHRQRMPKLADCLSFRLIHMDVEHLTRWVQQLQGQNEAMYKYAIKCLWSLVDGTEFFVDQVEATVGKAFSEKELRGFKAYVTDKSDLKDTPLQLRKRLVAGCKDKAREVLTEIARQEHEKFKDEEDGDGGDFGGGGGDIPSTPPTPPTPPAPVEQDWVKETEIARDTDALEEMRIQEGTAPAPKAESLGEKLQALHQELDQAVLEHELAPSPKFTKFPQDWVRWLEKRLEGQEVHATVLKNMVQVSMERSYKEMKFHPSEERLDALEAELRKHYRMGVRGESDKDFEVFEEYQKEFTAGNAEMITDIQRGIISDWWGSHAFNHNIASEIVMPIADRVYREVVAEYQESLRERETKKETILSTPACQDVSLQEADAIITREGLKRPRIDALMAGSGLQTWTNLDGSITLVKVVDKEKGRKYWHDMKAKDPNWDLREGIQYLAK